MLHESDFKNITQAQHDAYFHPRNLFAGASFWEIKEFLDMSDDPEELEACAPLFLEAGFSDAVRYIGERITALKKIQDK